MMMLHHDHQTQTLLLRSRQLRRGSCVSAALPATSRLPAASPANTKKQQKHDNAHHRSEHHQHLVKFALPLQQGLLRAYAGHRKLLHELLATPELDAKLEAAAPSPLAGSSGVGGVGAAEVRWAAATVEAAVEAASRVAWADGGGGGGGGNNNRLAAAAGTTPAAAALAPCNEDDDSEQCVVTWLEEEEEEEEGGDGNNDSSSAAAATPTTAAAAVEAAAARLFLHRALYALNTLTAYNSFAPDLELACANERSAWVARLREAIEAPWQRWELRQLAAAHGFGGDGAAAAAAGGGGGGSSAVPPRATAEERLLAAYRVLSPRQLRQRLRARFDAGLDPPASPALAYLRDRASASGYAHLVAIGAFDGLVEASRQSRVCAGAANGVAAAVFRVLVDEYGGGRLERKHSTYYAKMLRALGLPDEDPHALLDLVPWQALAAANHNFFLTERRRWFVRYCGALAGFELGGPATYRAYVAAAQRCGLPDAASAYWRIHVADDARHGRVMLDDVALPLVDMYGADNDEEGDNGGASDDDGGNNNTISAASSSSINGGGGQQQPQAPHQGRHAHEVLWGWEQDEFIGGRATAAIAAHVRAAEDAAAAAGAAGDVGAAQEEEKETVAA